MLFTIDYYDIFNRFYHEKYQENNHNGPYFTNISLVSISLVRLQHSYRFSVNMGYIIVLFTLLSTF